LNVDKWWEPGAPAVDVRRALCRGADEVIGAAVDEAVDERGMAVDSAAAIHEPCGRNWGCAGDAVDGSGELSRFIHDRGLAVPTLRSGCPRSTQPWMARG